MKIAVQDVGGKTIAFGAQLKKLLPPMSQIPDEFKHFNPNHKWQKVASTWFFCGLKNAKWTPKAGVDTEKALLHVAAIMASMEPRHEHKEAGCAYLLSEFFEDVTYEPAKP